MVNRLTAGWSGLIYFVNKIIRLKIPDYTSKRSLYFCVCWIRRMWGNLSNVLSAAVDKVSKIGEDLEAQMDESVGKTKGDSESFSGSSSSSSSSGLEIGVGAQEDGLCQ